MHYFIPLVQFFRSNFFVVFGSFELILCSTRHCCRNHCSAIVIVVVGFSFCSAIATGLLVCRNYVFIFLHQFEDLLSGCIGFHVHTMYALIESVIGDCKRLRGVRSIAGQKLK